MSKTVEVKADMYVCKYCTYTEFEWCLTVMELSSTSEILGINLGNVRLEIRLN